VLKLHTEQIFIQGSHHVCEPHSRTPQSKLKHRPQEIFLRTTLYNRSLCKSFKKELHKEDIIMLKYPCVTLT